MAFTSSLLRCCLAPRGFALLLLVAAGCLSLSSQAQDEGVLGECMALSPVDDDIHACLDNYLDIMDDNLRDITAFIRREFDGDMRVAFNRSQAAFETFRRENCLWYLAISSPRSVAEQIAKNCLAQLSVERLAELQSLLARDDASTQVVDGFFVYGANRNSFRPCGADGRYLVAGDAGAVGELQQRYSSLASVDLQILFASVTGEIDSSADGGADHEGVINISSVRDLRFPSESDCSLPTGSPQVAAVSATRGQSATSVEERVAEAEPVTDADIAANAEADAELEVAVAEPVATPSPVRSTVNPVADPGPRVVPPSTPVVEPAPSVATTPSASTSSAASSSNTGDGAPLTAYFGAWLADCSGAGGSRRCTLAVELDGGSVKPTLMLNRQPGGRIDMELSLPGRELESVDQILWGIDGYLFGKVPGSTLQVGDQLSLQLIKERYFVDNEMMPLMKRGSELRIEIGSAADGGAAQYRATLIGLSRAISFSDDFLGL